MDRFSDVRVCLVGDRSGVCVCVKLQALVYDILPLEEGAGKRCSECVGVCRLGEECWGEVG